MFHEPGIPPTCARKAALSVALVVAGSALALAVREGVATASTCDSSGYMPSAKDREGRMAEASRLVTARRWPDARAIYALVLADDPRDGEALFGLARVDAWDGCWERADSEYARALSLHPKDAEVRAGYVDLLTWDGRLDASEKALDDGLAFDPKAPSLLMRKARLAYWRGDATKANALADEAERLAPGDGDLREMRRKMFVGEARVTARLDHYPPGYQDLYTIGAQVLERVHTLELYGGAAVVRRYGVDGVDPVIDVRLPVGATYHPALGVALGGELAFAVPGHALPDLAVKGWGLAPLVGRFSAYLSYQYWHFGNGAIVHIANPSLGVALPHEIQLALRGYVSVIRTPDVTGHAGETQVAGAAGVGATWSATPGLDIGASYTYGAELEQNPALFQLQTFHSHVASAFADVLFGRHDGVRPLVGFERRQGPSGDALSIFSAELGAYVRW